MDVETKTSLNIAIQNIPEMVETHTQKASTWS